MKLKPYISAMVVLTTLAMSASPAMAATNTRPVLNFNAMPIHASKLNKHVATWFLDKGIPGKTINDALVIQNESGKAITVHMETVKAVTGINGGIVYDSGHFDTWVKNLPSSVTLGAHEKKIVDFVINVPEGATPGDYVSGIDLWNGKAQKVTQRGNKISIDIKEQLKRNIAVDVQIGGPKNTKIIFNPPGYDSIAGGVTSGVINMPIGQFVQVGGYNQSNFITRNLDGNVELYQNGKLLWTRPIRNLELDSNAPFTLQYPIHQGTLPVGHYDIHITLHNKNYSVSQDLQFSVTPKVQRQLAQITGQQVPLTSLIPTWLYALIGVLATGFITFMILVVRMMRRGGKKS